MSKIWYVPIEPLAERYSESWYRNIPKFFESKGAEVYTISGYSLTQTVEVGTFLDINSTVYYKSVQLAKIAELFHRGHIKNGDCFWFGDAEFWGLESVRLMAQMNKVKIFMFAFLHAASYTREDAFAVAAPYQKWTEIGWLEACDVVFVGSAYHKRRALDERCRWVGDKIQVTGNPLFKNDYPDFSQIKKKQKLILPNRFDWEKRPNISLDFAYLLKKRNPELQIVVTTSRKKFRSNRQWLVDYARELEKDGVITILENMSKDDYHKELAGSKVMLSNTIEENFGYCIIEACIYGCWPVVERAYSHPELLNYFPGLMFKTEDEIIGQVEDLLVTKADPAQLRQYAEYYYGSMARIWGAMSATMEGRS